ncbi:iron-sulfur cluster assembly protein CIA1 [Aspergillus homomorphus CBS 101889]|uniref:Probable cytosolic iron-sulfur protein assembly protein 1 n=1 Tax=Aspergillus homomorphus (strain CBS 101889) TaxID=1450537 RepID=A0A395HN53_ASPHC|nr:putative cytosolic iron-sulfur protein assembly protein 1 [Aspergillus homomorphus CBS 101889]RAL09267.1 putative cytosolic iron-sulfur protein assembly protein 1 [Aspergillus homomorphus CBS 101889]
MTPAQPAQPTYQIHALSTLDPPSLERTWQTAPHPRLPIVATCSSDKTIRIYSLTNFRLLSTITGGHKRSVRTAAWKPHVEGESVLATGSFDATAGIWRRWDNYLPTSQAAELLANTDEVAEGSNEAATAAHRPTQTLDHEDDEEDEEEWRFAVLLDGHDSEVKSVAWSPSGMLLATCSRDKSIWIWEDLDDGDNNFETVAVMQEHEGDVKCVAWHPREECLVSGSYDDTIRVWREDLDDWGQVACLRGHGGTVWGVAFEGVAHGSGAGEDGEEEKVAVMRVWKEQEQVQFRALSGPRILSCSDDRSVRVWRRLPKEVDARGAGNMPSIIRPTGLDEHWEEEATLPPVHDLAVYSVAWSSRTGLIASVGADGRIVVYEERFVAKDAQAMETDASLPDEQQRPPKQPLTEWVVVAVLVGAHGIYEINHVAWAKRADRGRDTTKEEEILITTADDGSVKVWTVGK